MIINLDFQINWSHLKENYYPSENSSKRSWFKQMDRNFREDLKKPKIVDMNKLPIDIPFFTWLIIFADSLGIQGNIFTLPSITV